MIKEKLANEKQDDLIALREIRVCVRNWKPCCVADQKQSKKAIVPMMNMMKLLEITKHLLSLKTKNWLRKE